MSIDTSSYLKYTSCIGTHIHNIDNKFVQVFNHFVPYDYLVVATGNQANASNAVRHDYKFDLSSLKTNPRVLIIDGGLAGVELAVEIKEYFPSTKVTLFAGSDRLLSGLNEHASNYAMSRLRILGVEVFFNQINVSFNGVDRYTTHDGIEIFADIIYDTTPRSRTPHIQVSFFTQI